MGRRQRGGGGAEDADDEGGFAVPSMDQYQSSVETRTAFVFYDLIPAAIEQKRATFYQDPGRN